MIPKIIHQTAKTIAIPSQWRPLQQQVRQVYADWEYRLWTDADNWRLVNTQYPELLSIYEQLDRPIMRVDLIRYLIMDCLGGVYLDLDYEFIKYFDFSRHQLVLPRESADDAPKVYLGNAVFGSIPGHPFWRAVINSLLADPPNRFIDISEETVIDLTGPGFLTRVYHQQFVKDQSIHVPPKLAFNPPIPRTADEYQTLKSLGSSFGIHYCHGTWRALTFGEKLTYRVKRIFRKLTKIISYRK